MKYTINQNPGKRQTRNWVDIAEMKDECKYIEFLQRNRFENIRQLEDGSWVGIFPLAFTWAVCTDITYSSTFAYRWCFGDYIEALKFVSEITEFDEIPKEFSSLKGHRYTDEPRLRAFDHLNIPRW